MNESHAQADQFKPLGVLFESEWLTEQKTTDGWWICGNADCVLVYCKKGSEMKRWGSDVFTLRPVVCGQFLKWIQWMEMSFLSLEATERNQECCFFYGAVCWGKSITARDSNRLDKLIKKCVFCAGWGVHSVGSLLEDWMGSRMQTVLSDRNLTARQNWEVPQIFYPSCYKSL